MALTSLPTRPEMSEAEWQTRCDLAALYRILHHLRMTDLIYTHMSARVPGEDGCFLINNYGELFDEVTASSLVKMDLMGNVLGDQDSYNEAGFTIQRGQVVMDKSIKILGLHDIRVNLHPEVSVKVVVNVARSADEAETQLKTGFAVTGGVQDIEDEPDPIAQAVATIEEVETAEAAAPEAEATDEPEAEETTEDKA